MRCLLHDYEMVLQDQYVRVTELTHGVSVVLVVVSNNLNCTKRAGVANGLPALFVTALQPLQLTPSLEVCACTVNPVPLGTFEFQAMFFQVLPLPASKASEV